MDMDIICAFVFSVILLYSLEMFYIYIMDFEAVIFHYLLLTLTGPLVSSLHIFLIVLVICIP